MKVKLCICWYWNDL